MERCVESAGRFALILAVVVSGAVGALTPKAAADESLLSFGIGYYDIFDDEEAVDFRAEYRAGFGFFDFIHPWGGLEVTSDGAVFGVGGLLLDIDLGEKLVLTPSFGAGLYDDGEGKELGNTVQFRSQIELGYRFGGGSRVSLAISHISNASLGDDNPGTEIATLYYHVPISSLFPDD